MQIIIVKRMKYRPENDASDNEARSKGDQEQILQRILIWDLQFLTA